MKYPFDIYYTQSYEIYTRKIQRILHDPIAYERGYQPDYAEIIPPIKAVRFG